MDYDLLNLLDEDEEDDRLNDISILISQFLKEYFDSRDKSSVAEFERKIRSFQNSLNIEFDTQKMVSEFITQGLLSR